MKANQLIVTPLMVAIHRRSDSPVYAERSIHLSVDDMGEGAFLRIRSQVPSETGEGEITIDMDELELVCREARKLINAHRALEDKK